MTEQDKVATEVTKPLAGTFEVEGIPHVFHAKDYECESAEEFLPRPYRDRRLVNFIDVKSLALYLERHKTNTTAIYVQTAWPKGPLLNPCLAIAFMDDGKTGQTSWRDHAVHLTPILSQPFQDWREIDGSELSQLDLVLFLDRHIDMIVKPTGNTNAPSASEVMSFAANLSDVKKVEFRKSINLDNGRVQLTYNESEGAAGAITIPREFWIKVQPILGHSSEYMLRVAMRYRIVDTDRLIFTLDLRDIDKLLEQLRGEIVEDLQAQLSEFPIYMS